MPAPQLVNPNVICLHDSAHRCLKDFQSKVIASAGIVATLIPDDVPSCKFRVLRTPRKAASAGDIDRCKNIFRINFEGCRLKP